MEELFLFLDKLIEKTLLDSSEIDKKLWEIAQRYLGKFPTDDAGKIEYNERTQTIINQLTQSLQKELEKSSYKKLASSILLNFDEVLKNNQAIQKELSAIEFSKKVLDSLTKEKQLVVNATTSFLSQSGINANVIFPIQKTLLENASFGYTQETFEKRLKERILGNKEVAGTIERYLGQIARDSLYQYDGTINNIVAQEYGLNAYRYVGTTVNDTRPQCKRWLNKKILKESELTSEIQWAKKNGSGMIPQTNKSNFIVYRAGYNCRHRAIPIKIQE